ncbi:MAG: YibE/F family protein [Lachnospiraceae bacterium]|nr:YibE/F family protein [Lachnospiraceae bacterium]
MLKRIYLSVAILVIAVVIFYNSVERTPLVADDNTEFAKAVVLQVLNEDLLDDGEYAGTQEVTLRITSGTYKGEVVEGTSMNGYLYGAYCTEGQKVIVRLSVYEESISATVYNYDRELPIAILVLIFLALMWIVGGKRGIHSIVALVFTFLIVLMLYLPMLYLGFSPFFAAVICVGLITVISILLIGGVSTKSLCAIIGTVSGVVAAGLIALIFGTVAHIDGYKFSNVETLIYVQQNSNLNVSGILFSSILISALGAVMDVAMSVSSSLTEIHEKTPELPVRELFRSGMRIGRDMIGTMSNTLILAYVGNSANILIVIYAYSYPLHQVLNMYDIGIQIMQGLSGTMGIILTVPIVSAVSAAMLVREGKKKTAIAKAAAGGKTLDEKRK